MAINIGKAISRFGTNVARGVSRFGVQAGKDLKKVGEFVKEKALPAIEKASGQAGKVLAMATPFVAGIAPELAPLVYGASRLASAIGSGARTGSKLIKQGEDTVAAIKRNDVKSAVMSGQALRRDLRI
jgi:hypothetical protein